MSRGAVGFMGPSGAGKDYLAVLLCEPSESTYERIGFADALREEVRAALNPAGTVPGVWEVPLDPQVRGMLQWWGTERRTGNVDWWVDRVRPRVYAAQQAGRNPVFTDVRFPNEAEYVRSLGGFLIWVGVKDRGGFQLDPAGEPWRRHQTETSLTAEDADVVFVNDKTAARTETYSRLMECLTRRS